MRGRKAGADAPEGSTPSVSTEYGFDPSAFFTKPNNEWWPEHREHAAVQGPGERYGLPEVEWIRYCLTCSVAEVRLREPMKYIVLSVEPGFRLPT